MTSATFSNQAPDTIVAGRLRRTDGTWGPGEVWIDGERILAVHEGPTAVEGTAAAAATRIDVGDAFVLPGAVDAHVHSLSHHGEGVRAATRAAAAGGVTTIVEMPFDGAGPINSRDRLRAKQDVVAAEANVDVALLGTMSPNGGWREAEALAEDGVVGFKVSLFLTDAHRFPRIDDFELLSVMRAAAATGRTLCTHAENNEIVKALLESETAARPTDPQAHSRTRPPVSETLGVLTALEVAANEGSALHVCHLSLPRSIDLVRWYQSQGVDVTLETCPHYLTFTRDDLDVQRGRLKINPPLRTAADREGLWSRLESGAVGVVSSDHAPWPAELKDHDHILDNHSGVPGVETLVAVTLGRALQRDDSLTAFGAAVEALTIGPARRFGLEAEKGSLTAGKHADLLVFAPGDSAIDGGALHSNAGWSPYDGIAPGGAVTHTFSRGELVFSRGAGLVSADGRGRILTRVN
jgi:allantoinase